MVAERTLLSRTSSIYHKKESGSWPACLKACLTVGDFCIVKYHIVS